MSNILKVTTPVTGYETANRVKTGPSAPTDPSIQGQVNPEKVMKPDARSDAAGQEQNVGLKFQYESNFQGFLSQMSGATAMSEEFVTLLFSKFATLAESGMGENFAQEIGKFFQMIQTGPQDLLPLLKNQGNASIRFSGAFFTLLRQVMAETSSVELKACILDFMKRYTDMAEGQHIMDHAKNYLEAAKERMFKGGQQKLSEIEQEMVYQARPGSSEMAGNAKVLKERILPFLNQYISQTHDRGVLRDATAMLSALAARCENGDAGRILDAFEKLMKFQGMQKYFKGFDPAGLFQVLENTEFEKANKQQGWIKQMADIIEAGAAGEAGTEQKSVFKNLMHSILLNESVYMPVLHMMLPIQYEGVMSFAEMWVDPDAQDGRAGREDSERVVQGLIKFDIQNLGFFDLYFVYQGGGVRMQLNCPEELSDKSQEIHGEVSRILAEAGLKSEELFIGNSKESIPLSEAFPKIYERKNSINVRI